MKRWTAELRDKTVNGPAAHGWPIDNCNVPRYCEEEDGLIDANLIDD